jgi:hypothetical protein
MNHIDPSWLFECAFAVLFVGGGVLTGYLWWSASDRPFSRLRWHALWTANFAIVCIPVAVVGIVFGGVVWLHYGGWGLPLLGVAVGLLAAILFGNCFAAISLHFKKYVGVPRQPLQGTVVEAGPRWSDRQAAQRSNTVQPASDGLSEGAAALPHQDDD